MSHAQYSPSRLKQIIACPGCIQLERIAKQKGRIVEQQSEAAQHGTMLHECIENIINAHGCVCDPPARAEVDAHLEKLEQDDRGLIYAALEYFYQEMGQYKEEEILYWALEQQVTMEDFGFPEVFGTADVVILTARDGESKLHVFDWKFGRYQVNAHNNDQLNAYCHGAYGALSDMVLTDVTIHLDMPIAAYIVQPKIDNYQKWETKLSLPWCHSLRHAIDDAESSEPSFAPTEQNCLWCGCKSLCRARLDQANETAQSVFEILAQTPEAWTEGEVQFLLGKLMELKKVADDILKDYEARLKEGKKVPGFKLVQGQGRRYFPNFEDVIDWFDENHPEVEVFEAKPKSPAKLEKEIPLASRRSPEFQQLIDKKHGIKMVRDTEAGEEIKRGTEAAQEAFKEFV